MYNNRIVIPQVLQVDMLNAILFTVKILTLFAYQKHGSMTLLVIKRFRLLIMTSTDPIVSVDLAEEL